MQGGSSSGGRRRTVRIGIITVVASLIAGLFTVGGPAKGATQYETYHHASSASHAAKTKALLAYGFRPISLSVFGATSAPTYAATWVMRPGSEVRVLQDQSPSTFARTAGSMSVSGFRLALITAVSDAAGTIFASTWERDPSGRAVFDTDMTIQGFTARNKSERANGLTLRSAVAYGSRFAATWWYDDYQVPWNVETGLSRGDLDAIRLAHNANAVRLDLMSFGSGSSAGTYLGVWRDDRIGPTAIYSSLTKLQYEETLKLHESHTGMFPVRLQAGLAGGEVRYAAIFAHNDEIMPRQWTVTGPDSGPVGAGFDQQVRNLMSFSGVRTGALAVVKGGKLVHSRGYTWAETGAKATLPTTQFRLASCTKPLTAIAVAQLVEQKKLNYGDKVQDILHLTTPTGGSPSDTRFKDITIDNLLTHTAGWDREITPEPWDPDVAAAFGAQVPVTAAQKVSYAAGRTLDFSPSDRWAYSNVGFNLLGRVIEAKTGASYASAMKKRVFDPLGLTRPGIGGSSKATQATDESVYVQKEPSVIRSVAEPARPVVAGPYGAWNLESADAHGGLRMAAPDLARVLAAFDQPDNPMFANDDLTVQQMWSAPIPAAGFMTRGWLTDTVNDANGASLKVVHHNGRLPGESCLMTRRSDGVSIVLLLGGERDLFGEVQGRLFNDRVNEWPFSSWPTTDLFPQMGVLK